jgi:hypothetical protein
MQRTTLGHLSDLLAATESVCNDECVSRSFANGGQEYAFTASDSVNPDAHSMMRLDQKIACRFSHNNSAPVSNAAPFDLPFVSRHRFDLGAG